MELKKQSSIKVPHRQAWIDTFVWLCPYYDQREGNCHRFERPINCNGPSTYVGAGACGHVMEYFMTFIKFVNKELKI